MTKDHFYCVPHTDLKVCDSSTVVVDDDVKFRRGAQSYNGKVFAVSGSEEVISEHIQNMKKAKKKKEDSFHEDKPRKSKLKSREMMSMLKPRSKSLKQSPKKVAAIKKRKSCQEKAKLQEEMEIEPGTTGDDSLDKKGGSKDDDTASVGSTTKASSSESESESNQEESKTEGNGATKDIKLLQRLANRSSSFAPLKLEASSILGVHNDLTANTSADKDTVKDKSKKKAKASSLSDSEEEPKEEDKKKQARSSLEFIKEDPKDKKKQANSSPESEKEDSKNEKKKRAISSSDSEEEDSKEVKKTAASSSSESEDEQKNQGNSSSESDNEDSKPSPKRKKDKRHASPSGSEDESKPKAKKARRNLEVYPGKNFNWASTDPGVVQLTENLNVYVKEIDLREALRSKSTLLFVRKIVPAVYTTKAMEEATPQGFPERGKGKDYYVGKKPKPRLDPHGWRAIRERALLEQRDNKTWRPKVDEQRIMTVFSSVVCSYKK